MTTQQRVRLKAIKKAVPSFIGHTFGFKTLVVTFVNSRGRTISQHIDQRGFIRRSYEVTDRCIAVLRNLTTVK